ncbi:MAG: hypothetical protein A3H27_08785 [Acidobacteria bacterium RIFCSPLOWO2_02_FULL_59_13]|nr:MAG: hypothetical protein A3H27_08785 [Acidobacteria bacterium RIFCSPLOWO2_02_FULL_59_13]
MGQCARIARDYSHTIAFTVGSNAAQEPTSSAEWKETMIGWLKSLFKGPEQVGLPSVLREFGPTHRPITHDGVSADQAGWRIHSEEERTVRLFEVLHPNVEQCILTYRVQMKTENVKKGAYLEMWCQFPGRGEFFSKGLHHRVKGTVDWASYETPFYLRKGQRPDLVKLNVVMEGSGTLWLRYVELLQTPLSG